LVVRCFQKITSPDLLTFTIASEKQKNGNDTGTVKARIISTPMMVDISKSTQSILVRFAAYETKFC
jgi:hypothetical protein